MAEEVPSEVPTAPTCPQILVDHELAAHPAAASTVTCHGVHVNFPFPPYPQQVKYMDAVVDACENSKNAMLESPTGTGKTLSLLCSSLGWLHSFRKKCPETSYPRIVYLSRTHSQLSQVAKELKKTTYRPVIATLASRDQLCINPNANVYRGPLLNITCKKLRRNNMCPYAFNKQPKSNELKTSIYDIEDLQAFGVRTRSCPYYASRDLIPAADLLLMPYNYLLDAKIRAQSTTIQYTNSVIIFDEAHNVQRIAEESSSFEVSLSELKKCIEEIRQIQKIKQSVMLHEELYEDLKADMDEISEEDMVFLESPIECFIDYLNNVPNVGPEGVVYEGKMLFDIFLAGTKFSCMSSEETKDGSATDPEKYFDHDQTGITPKNYFRYLVIIKKCIDILSTRNTGLHLDQWYRIIETVYTYMTKGQVEGQLKDNSAASTIEDFKVAICDETPGTMGADEEFVKKKKGFGNSAELQRRRADSRCLKAFCFNPGLAFVELLKASPRCILLTSGTLSPMDSLEHELRIKFPIKLESDHVINPDQAFVQVLTRDQSGSLFNFNYQNRGNVKQRSNLGKMIQSIVDATPGGVLVFFSSYSILAQCWDMWSDDVIPAIRKVCQKSVFREEKTAVQNQKTLEQYKKAIENGEGAVLFAVCRGKVSEGIDFSDDAARAVVVVGVPFPCMGDKRVSLKQEYLDRRNQVLQINGKTWYTQEAMKAVNQTIGRVIRHIYDYGAIVLIDQRYSNEWLRRHLSKWIKDKVKVTTRCEDCVESLGKFFERMKEKKFPVRAPVTEVSPAEELQPGSPALEEKKVEKRRPKPNPKKSATSPTTATEKPCGESQEVAPKPKPKKRTRKPNKKTEPKLVTKAKKEVSTQSPTVMRILDEEEKEKEKEKKQQVTPCSLSQNPAKDQWMKSLYDFIAQTLGVEKMKRLVTTFQTYRAGKENSDPTQLSKAVYSLFAGKECDDALLEQTNDAIKKTSYLVKQSDRTAYLDAMSELMKPKKTTPSSQ